MTGLGFADLGLILKVTVELNRSNLDVCGGWGTSVYSESNTTAGGDICRLMTI